MANDGMEGEKDEPLNPYHCTVCDIQYATENELKEHKWSLIHHVRLNQKDKKDSHSCDLCGVAPLTLVTFTQHVNGKRHRKALMKFKSGIKTRPGSNGGAKRSSKRWLQKEMGTFKERSEGLEDSFISDNEENLDGNDSNNDSQDSEEQGSTKTSKTRQANADSGGTSQEKHGAFAGHASRKDGSRAQNRFDRSHSREHRSLEKRIEDRARESKEKKKSDWSKQKNTRWPNKNEFSDMNTGSFRGPLTQQAKTDGDRPRWSGGGGNWVPMMQGPLGGPPGGPPPGWLWNGPGFNWNQSANAGPPPPPFLPPHMLQQHDWPPNQFNQFRYNDPRFSRPFQEHFHMNWQGNQFGPSVDDKSDSAAPETLHDRMERPTREFRNSQSASDDQSDVEKLKDKRELSPNRKDAFNLSLKAGKIIDDVLNKKSKASASPSKSESKDKTDIDHGADLLERAEKLCKDLREKRQMSQVKREGDRSKNQQQREEARDREISNLNNRAMSKIRGYVSDEGSKAEKKGLSDSVASSGTLDEGIIRGPNPGLSLRHSGAWQSGRPRQSGRELGGGYSNRYQQFTPGSRDHGDRHWSSSRRYDASPDGKDGSRSRPGNKSQGSFGPSSNKGSSMKSQAKKKSDSLQQPVNTKVTSAVTQRPFPKKISSSLARALKKRLNKPSAEVTKDELMKLVNAPRSRKERLQIAHLVQSSRLQQRLAARPKLHLGGDNDPPVDLTGDIDESQLALSLDDLPDDIKHQILQLIDEEMASQDSEVEEIDKGVMDIEELALRSDEDADLISLLSPPALPSQTDDPFQNLAVCSDQDVDIKPVIKTEHTEDPIATNTLSEITTNGLNLMEVKSDELMLLSRLGITQEIPTKDTDMSSMQINDEPSQSVTVSAVPSSGAANQHMHQDGSGLQAKTTGCSVQSAPGEDQKLEDVHEDSDSSTTSGQSRLEVGAKRRRNSSLDKVVSEAASVGSISSTQIQDAKRLKIDVKEKQSVEGVSVCPVSVLETSAETPMDCLSLQKPPASASSSPTVTQSHAQPSYSSSSLRLAADMPGITLLADPTTTLSPGHLLNQPSSSISHSDLTTSSVNDLKSSPMHTTQSSSTVTLPSQSEHSPIIIDQSPPKSSPSQSDTLHSAQSDDFTQNMKQALAHLGCSDSTFQQRLASLCSSPSKQDLSSVQSADFTHHMRQVLASLSSAGASLPQAQADDFTRSMRQALASLNSSDDSRPHSAGPSSSPKPSMPPPSDRNIPVEPDRLASSFTSTYTNDSLSSNQASDCVDTVLEISLQEESVRSKLQETEQAIERLQALLHQTQEQLKRRVQVRDRLLKQEEELRARRIQVLKGAVAERRSGTPASSTRSNSPRVPRDMMDFTESTAHDSGTSEWDSASTLRTTGSHQPSLAIKTEEPAEREETSEPSREARVINVDMEVKEETASSVDLNTSLEPDTTTHESSIDIQNCIKQEIQQVIAGPTRESTFKRSKSHSFSMGDERKPGKEDDDDDQVHAHYVGTLQIDKTSVNSSSEQELLQKLVENLAALRKTSYMVLTEDEVLDKSGSEAESQLDSSQENIHDILTSEKSVSIKREKSPVQIDAAPVEESAAHARVPLNDNTGTSPVRDAPVEKYDPYPINIDQQPKLSNASKSVESKSSKRTTDHPEETKSSKKLLKSPKAKRKSPRIRSSESSSVKTGSPLKDSMATPACEAKESSAQEDGKQLWKSESVVTPASPKTKKRKARRVRDEKSARMNEADHSSSDSDSDMETQDVPQTEKANMRRRKSKKLPVETAKLVQEYFHAESSSDVEIAGLERQPVPLTPPRQDSPLLKETRRQSKRNQTRSSTSPTEDVNKPKGSALRRSRRNRRLSSPTPQDTIEEPTREESSSPALEPSLDVDKSGQEKQEQTENPESEGEVVTVDRETRSKRSSPQIDRGKKPLSRKRRKNPVQKSSSSSSVPVPEGENMDTDSRDNSEQEPDAADATGKVADTPEEAADKDVTVSSSTDAPHTSSFMPVEKSLKLQPEAVEFFREAVRKGRLNIRDGATPDEATVGEFHGHTGAIHCVVVWDKWLITAAEDHTVRKFNLATHECEEVYRGHTKGVQCVLVVSVFPLGIRLYSGSFDNSIACFDFETGDQLMKMMCAHRVHCCSEGWGRLYVGLGNGNVLCLDLKTNKTVDTFKCSDCPIRCISTAREGARKLLVVASTDCSITIRDAHSSLLIRTLEGHTKPPMTMTVINHLVYSGGADKTVQIHNLNNGELDRCLIQRGVVTSICLEGDVMVAAGYEGIIKVYDPKTWQLIQMYYGAGAGPITAMCLNNNMLYSGNREGLVDAVCLDPQKKYRCRFGSCGMLFGYLPHLERHVLHDHILPNQAVVRCLWKDCTEYMPGNKDTQATTEHILTHISDEYGTTEQASKITEKEQSD